MRKNAAAPSPAASHSTEGSSRRLRREEHDGGRQHDPVRNDPALEIGRRDRDEDGAERRADQEVPGVPELERRNPRQGAQWLPRPPGSATRSTRRSGGNDRAAPRTRRAARCRTTRGSSRNSGTPSRARRSNAAAGIRAATTFRKLPTARPGARTTAANPTFIRSGLRRARPGRTERRLECTARRRALRPRAPRAHAP